MQRTLGRSVVITGLGAFTPYGVGWSKVREGLDADVRAIASIDGLFPDVHGRVAGCIRDLAPFHAAFPDVRPPYPIRLTRIVMVAAHAAIADAAIDVTAPREDFGIVLERGRGPTPVVVKAMEPVFARGPRNMSPLLFSQSVSNAPAGAVATAFGLRGTHLLAIGGGGMLAAFDAIRRGDANAILCGGFDEIDADSFLAAERNGYLHATADVSAYRPGEASSPGAPRGEGCVCLVMEAASTARARGARVYAELAAVEQGLDFAEDGPLDRGATEGWGAPKAASLARYARAALDVAGEPIGSVGLAVGGASGVRVIDAAVHEAYRSLELDRLGVRSLKGHLGEMWGAATFASIAWVADSLERRQADCATLGRGRGVEATDARVALVTNLEFQGQHVAAVLRRSVA